MNARSVLPAVLVFLLMLAACDESPTGPDRAANVNSFPVNFRVRDVTFDGPYALVEYKAPEISPSVVDDGAVLAYARIDETWTALPYTYGVESAQVPAVDYTVTLGYAFYVGVLQVFYDVSLADPELRRDLVLNELPNRTIKVVVIEDFIAARSAVDVSSYEAVRQYFGLDSE